MARPEGLDLRLYAVYDGSGPDSLGGLCRGLADDQKERWPEYRQGAQSLKEVQVRHIPCNGFNVRVEHNPGRIRSTMAAVGRKDLAGRPCFLCLPNLPEEQRAILYREDYLILCNPMPVFPGHFTVSNVIHRPQTIEGNIAPFLALIADLGEEWTGLYNGPRCGASAPDHLHFQVIPSGHMPAEEETREAGRVESMAEIHGIAIGRARNMGREVLILEGEDPAAMGRAFGIVADVLKNVCGEAGEPMMSLVGQLKGGTFRLLLFPRGAHRPRAFFTEGDGKITISPAVIEMGGVLVAPVEGDFRRVDRAMVESIYREVSVDGSIMEAVSSRLARADRP